MAAKKTKSKSKSKKAAGKDAIALLKADHRKVEDLFKKFKNSRGRKKEIAQEICLELTIHTMIEEEIFYPACRGEIEESLSNEALVEHDGAKQLIAEIEAGNPEDEFYEAKVKVLSEEIKHHVKEEEQRDGMFAQAKAAKLDLDALGERLAARKAELMEEFKSQPLPVPTSRTMKGIMLQKGSPVQAQAAE